MNNEIRDKLDLILTTRPPIVKRALELYEFIKDCNGFVKGTTELLTQAVGLSKNSKEEFYNLLDELIDKDYIRVVYPTGNNKGKKNLYFTAEFLPPDFFFIFRQNSEPLLP